MKFSNRSKYLLLGLLALLNILIRLPSIPHERGSPDEFTMHILANSLSAFGHANWWVHPSSIFGFYPYSYASASPFVYSGISQCTGISLEWIAWIFCVLLGIFVMFSAYLMAGQIKNDDLFKLLVAFTVSLSLGVLNFLTWQISARGFFVALLPFFIYVLLKTRVFAIRCGALTFIMFIVLMATHHYYMLVVPVIFSFIVLTIFYKLKEHITKFIRFPDVLTSFFLLAGFLGMFSYPFFTGLFIQRSRYDALHLMLENTIRYSGPFLGFAIVGLSYLVLKSDREFGEWFLLFTVIFWAPFMWMYAYAHFLAVILICALMGIALVNIAKAYEGKRKQVFSIIIVILLLFVSFSGFYQHWRTQEKTHKGYMEDSTYYGGLWIKNNIDVNKRLACNDYYISGRTFSVSEVPTLSMPEADITYGFVNASDIKISKTYSPWSVKFHMDGPYVLAGGAISDFYRRQLLVVSVDSWWGNLIISKLNLSYMIEWEGIGDDIFILSIHEEKYNVYDNGRIRIWCLDTL